VDFGDFAVAQEFGRAMNSEPEVQKDPRRRSVNGGAIRLNLRIRVNVGQATDFPDRYRNLKAQLYWSLRERFQNGEVSGLDD